MKGGQGVKETALTSVIIPCFNSERWILETLSSVYSQTYPNIEVIVVDDGSVDNTKELVLSFDEKISYYYQENKGPSAARNLGIKKARGDYIAFLDSDDVWEQDKLSKQVNFLEKNEDVHLVFSNVTLINEQGETLYTHFNKVPSEKDEIIKKFFEGNITMNTPSIVARRDSVINAGGFDEELPLREDHFFLMMMTHKYKIFHFKEPLVKRRVSQQSMSNSIEPEKVFNLNTPFLLKSLEEFPFLSKYKKSVYSRMNATIGKGYWKNGNYTEGLKYMIKTIYYNPFKLSNYLFIIIILFRLEYQGIERLKWKARKRFKRKTLL